MGTTPPRGKADFLDLGDWNAQCFECGMKFKASTLKKHWQGYYVCPQHWETRQPQDFVRGVKDVQTPPWVQPQPANTFANVCFPNGISCYCGTAVSGCCIAGYVSPFYDPAVTS